ncbi:hypothetical protein V6N12_051253 [Hibiscus sabdariffa]|uniref:Uncharacterized protein n=1 Tax=Hibiscus sabdariffa TaxID=183260 RepID=A0ABR2GET3_9ROSI
MVEAGDAGDEWFEEERVSTTYVSPRWQKNQLWEEDGGVMPRVEAGESGSASMSDECVGMVNRIEEVERGAADGRVGWADDGESDMIGPNNPFKVIEFDPNSTGGLVVEQNHRIHLVSNSNSKYLTEFENLGSGGQQPESSFVEALQESKLKVLSRDVVGRV